MRTMPVNHGSRMKTQSSEWRTLETGVQNMVPKLVIQSNRMCDVTPTAANIHRTKRRARRAKSFATTATARARNGMTRNECVQPRCSRR